jgi:hypothetical protein
MKGHICEKPIQTGVCISGNNGRIPLNSKRSMERDLCDWYGNHRTRQFSCPPLYPGNQWQTVTLSGGGTKTSGPFTATASTVVNPGQNFQVSVVFNPSAPGSYSTTINFTYNSNLTLAVSLSGTDAFVGSIYPKYQVVSVIYAPPGQASSVNYGTSTQLGTSASWGSSISKSTTLATSLKIGVLSPINTSQTWTQTADTASTISVNKSTSLGISVPGPANSNVGINHDFDVIEVWINPKDDFTVTSSNSAQWKYNFDPRDPAKEVDIVPLYVHELKNPSTIPSGKKSLLARTWAGSGQGLTSTDYATILARDPFANGSTNIDATRFHLQIGQTLAYDPPPCGGQPITNTYTETYQTTTTHEQTAGDSYSVSYTRSAGGNFSSWLSANFLSQTTLTWTNKWGHQASTGSGKSATLSITGPSSCTYSGPVDVQVYEDNVYGTFMFDLF